MALLHIDELEPGMILSREVCDRSGRVLLPAGAELTARQVTTLQMWGVLEAEVVGEEKDSPSHPAESAALAALDPETAAAAREVVERLFAHNDPQHPAIKELMRICIERRAHSAA